MLRKTFLTTLLLCAIFFAQNVVAEDVIYVKSTESDSVPAAKSKSANLPTSHWAVFVDAGANIFAGDFNSAAPELLFIIFFTEQPQFMSIISKLSFFIFSNALIKRSALYPKSCTPSNLSSSQVSINFTDLPKL